MLSIKDLNAKYINKILDTAKDFETIGMHGNISKRPFICGLLFFEPSTRTLCSFQAAVARLGGTSIVLPTTNNSSMAKGETESDTVITMASYCDILVIRHPRKGSIKEFAMLVGIPVINAGDGAGEHPTQALLDLYTIRKHCGRLDNITVWAPDANRSRTVNSLSDILGLFSDNVVSPTAAPRSFDILYMTRYQKERHDDTTTQQNDRIILDMDFYKSLQKRVGIMHPLPRGPELPTEIDDLLLDGATPLYFEQMKNGVYIRMALLYTLLL